MRKGQMLSAIIFSALGFILTPTLAKYHEECTNVAIDSLIPAANDCRSFIHCSDEETSIKYTCPDETYYDKETGKCEFDYHNICPGRNDDTEESEIDEEEMNNISNETSEINVPVSTTSPLLITIYEPFTGITSKPNCSRQTNAYYPHSKRCEYYYKCVGGYLTISRCNFNYAWDYKKELCVPYNMVECIGGSSLRISA